MPKNYKENGEWKFFDIFTSSPITCNNAVCRCHIFHIHSKSFFISLNQLFRLVWLFTQRLVEKEDAQIISKLYETAQKTWMCFSKTSSFHPFFYFFQNNERTKKRQVPTWTSIQMDEKKEKKAALHSPVLTKLYSIYLSQVRKGRHNLPVFQLFPHFFYFSSNVELCRYLIWEWCWLVYNRC